MSKKRFIDTSFWSDVWVVDDLDKLQRYFFLYLITNGHTNVAGVYEISLKTMANESDFTKPEITGLLHAMTARVRYIDGWIVLRNGIKNQNYRNEKIAKAIENVFAECPEEAFEFLEIPKDFQYNKIVEKKKQMKLAVETGVVEQSTVDSGQMSHTRVMHESLHSDSDLDLDLDLERNSAGFKKSKTLNKKIYAHAVRADEALQQKEQQARTRPAEDGPGIKKARKAADIIKNKALTQGVKP